MSLEPDPTTLLGCNLGLVRLENSFYRAFPLLSFPAVEGPFTVQSVGIGRAASGTGIGATDEPESAPSFVRMPDCGFPEITDTTTLGFPNAHFVMAVNGFVCGNGGLDPGEQCDDGNVSAGDCCAPTCQFESDGSPCSDDNPCTASDACAAGVCGSGAAVVCPLCEQCNPAAGCAVAPRSGCRGPSLAPRTVLQLRDASPDTRDRLAWRWLRGAVGAASEFGDPTAADDYGICIFDEPGGTPNLLVRAPIPAGGSCGTKQCWRRLGPANRLRGFAYRDRAAASGGVSMVVLKPAGVALKGAGPNLGLPGGDSLGLPLRVQLQGPQPGQCWEASYSTARKNAGGRFKAKAD